MLFGFGVGSTVLGSEDSIADFRLVVGTQGYLFDFWEGSKMVDNVRKEGVSSENENYERVETKQQRDKY